MTFMEFQELPVKASQGQRGSDPLLPISQITVELQATRETPLHHKNPSHEPPSLPPTCGGAQHLEGREQSQGNWGRFDPGCSGSKMPSPLHCPGFPPKEETFQHQTCSILVLLFEQRSSLLVLGWKQKLSLSLCSLSEWKINNLIVKQDGVCCCWVMYSQDLRNQNYAAGRQEVSTENTQNSRKVFNKHQGKTKGLTCISCRSRNSLWNFGCVCSTPKHFCST